MQGQVYEGQLTSFDTDSRQIDVLENDGETYILSIDSNTTVRFGTNLRSLLGEKVKVIVIDYISTKIALIQED